MAEQPPQPKPKPVRKSTTQFFEENAPWKPTPYENRHALAMKRLHAGQANADEQRLALEWILKCSGVGDEPYRAGPDGKRDTLVALGKAMVGRQVVKLIKVNLSQLKGGEYGEHG